MFADKLRSSTFAVNVRILRLAHRWSQSELARKASRPRKRFQQRRLSLLENGLAPKPDEVSRLAEALGVTGDQLLGPNLIAVPMKDTESQPAA